MNDCGDKPVLGRREARRQDRREAILTIAGDSFLTNGYAATTMSGIAAEVGGSKATLWSYFPSKEALFEAVLDHATVAYRAHMRSLLDPSGDPELSLRSFCKSFLTKITSPQALALHRLVYAEGGRFPEVGRIFYERAPRATNRLLGDFIASLMERGALRSDDPYRAARVLTTLCMSGSHYLMVLGQLPATTPEQIDADVDSAMDMFLRIYAVG